MPSKQCVLSHLYLGASRRGESKQGRSASSARLARFPRALRMHYGRNTGFHIALRSTDPSARQQSQEDRRAPDHVMECFVQVRAALLAQ